MPDSLITDLPAIPAIATTDLVPMVHTSDNTTYKATFAQIMASITAEALKNFTTAEAVTAGDVVQAYTDSTIRKYIPGGLGAKSTLSSSESYKGDVVVLTPTTAVAVFAIGTVPNARVGTITGTTIAWGSPQPLTGFNIGATKIAVTYLSATKFVIAYSRSSDYYGMTCVGTVSGSTVSWGTPAAFLSGATHYSPLSIERLNDTTVAIVYTLSTFYDMTVVGTVSGTTIAWGTAVVADTLGSVCPATVCRLADNALLVHYPGNVRAATISGTTITFGTAVSTGHSGNIPGGADLMASNSFVISYTNTSAVYQQRARAGTFTGNTITLGSEISVCDVPSTNDSAVARQSDTALAFYSLASGVIIVYVLALSGTTLTITPQAVTVYAGTAPSLSQIGFIAGTYFLAGYWEGSTLSTQIVSTLLSNILGVAQASASAGTQVRVAGFGQLSPLYSGLTVGALYFWNSTFNGLALTGSIKAGYAISDTTLYVGVMGNAMPTSILGAAYYLSGDNREHAVPSFSIPLSGQKKYLVKWVAQMSSGDDGSGSGTGGTRLTYPAGTTELFRLVFTRDSTGQYMETGGSLGTVSIDLSTKMINAEIVIQTGLASGDLGMAISGTNGFYVYQYAFISAQEIV